MKTFLTTCLGLALFCGRSVAQAPAASAAPVPAPHATFTQPLNAHEGRDPFFPESTRVFESSQPAAAGAPTATSLKVMGYSVVNDRPMVIINNRTFMVGDENDVTAGGGRSHVRCLEIQPGTVVIEVNGIRHEIHF